MHRTWKLFMVNLPCAGILMVLLLTAVLTTHLLANRDMVKSFIISKTAQAKGGRLVYDRLDISFFPLPHLKARDIHLDRSDAFEVTAQELSVSLFPDSQLWLTWVFHSYSPYGIYILS